jgi:hypothetical protein
MKRSLQEIVELVVFGLIALLIGTGVLWLLGAVFGLVGTVLGWLAALLWGILSFLVPVALVAGAVVLIVRWSQGRPMPGSAGGAARGAAPVGGAPPTSGTTTPVNAKTEVPSDATTPDTTVDAERAAESTGEGMPPAPAGTPPVAVDALDAPAATDPRASSPADAPVDPTVSDDERRGPG